MRAVPADVGTTALDDDSKRSVAQARQRRPEPVKGSELCERPIRRSASGSGLASAHASVRGRGATRRTMGWQPVGTRRSSRVGHLSEEPAGCGACAAWPSRRRGLGCAPAVRPDVPGAVGIYERPGCYFPLVYLCCVRQRLFRAGFFGSATVSRGHSLLRSRSLARSAIGRLDSRFLFDMSR